MSTEPNRSTYYLNDYIGLGTEEELSRVFFYHDPEYEPIIDDDHKPMIDGDHLWNIKVREDHVHKLSLYEILKTNPVIILKGVTVLALSSMSVYFSMSALSTESAWVKLFSVVSITLSVLFIIYVILGSKREGDLCYTQDKDVTVFQQGHDKPSFSNKYRLDVYEPGSFLAGRVPDSILKDYDFAQEIVKRNEHLLKQTMKRNNWNFSFRDKDNPDYQPRKEKEDTDCLIDDDYSEEDLKRYKKKLLAAFNIALNDPVSHFETKELAYTIAEYNEKVPWDVENDFLVRLFHSFFTVIDEAWNRHKKKEEEEYQEMIFQQEREEQQRQEVEQSRRNNAREEAERRLTTVEALRELHGHKDAVK